MGRAAEVAHRIKTTGSGVAVYDSTGSGIDMTLAQLHFGANWTQNSTTSTADNLLIWNAPLARFDTYFQKPDSTWRISGDATTDKSNVVIPAGGAISILKRGAVSGQASYLVPVLPY
jgi:hypothetical protein